MGLLKSTVASVRKGLQRTRDAFAGSLRKLLFGRDLNDDVIDEIEALLLTADVGVATTTRAVEALRTSYRRGEVTQGEEALELLKRQLKANWTEADRSIATAPSAPTVILVAGVNGSGKTTSVAKIAKLLKDDGRRVLLAAADTFRAGALAQLETWAKRLDVEIVMGAPGADPAAVTFDAAQAAKSRDVDVLLIDTAGRLHTDPALMRQLTKIRDVVRKQVPGAPHEVLLVVDSTQGQNAVNQARDFKSAIDVTGIFLAKLDGTAKGGIVLAIRDMLDIPVKLVGVGETPDDVQPFDPDAFIEAMFEG
jgi:fused signal recognition particle receptor